MPGARLLAQLKVLVNKGKAPKNADAAIDRAPKFNNANVEVDRKEKKIKNDKGQVC